MDPESKDTIESSVPSVPILLPKRKRGRPRKVPSATMDMITSTTALDEVRGSLGIEQLSSPHVVDVVSIDPVEDSIPTILPEPLMSSPTKKGRGRPRKHPLPVPGTEPTIKRKRGRPPKVPTTPTELPPTESVTDGLITERIRNSTHVVPTAMLVPPPELVPEPTQVNVASSDRNLDQAEIPLIVVPIGLLGEMDSPSDEPITKKRGRPRKNPPRVIDPNAVKRKRGRPKKNPLLTSPNPKKGRGRPKKNLDDFEAENQPVEEREWQPPKESDGEATEMPEKRPRGRPRKHPKPENDEPVVKRKRGRPKKEPVAIDVNEEPIPISDQIPIQSPPKKKRGRPKKNPAAALAPIPAQSSEPLLPSFPAVTISPYTLLEPTNLNARNDTGKPSKAAFQHMLCASDSEIADFSTVAYTTALQKSPRKDSPLLDDRFVESSDEDD